MKYFVLVVFLVFVLATAGYAGEKEDLMSEIRLLQDKIANGKQAIASLEVVLTEKIGVYKYLNKKEKEEVAKLKEDEGDIELKKEK